MDDAVGGLGGRVRRSRRRRRPWRVAARRRRRPSAVSVDVLRVSTLPVLIDMFSSFLAMPLEEADVAPQLEGLERHEAPVAVEGANRAAAAAAR